MIAIEEGQTILFYSSSKIFVIPYFENVRLFPSGRRLCDQLKLDLFTFSDFSCGCCLLLLAMNNVFSGSLVDRIFICLQEVMIFVVPFVSRQAVATVPPSSVLTQAGRLPPRSSTPCTRPAAGCEGGGPLEVILVMHKVEEQRSCPKAPKGKWPW